VCSSDLTCQAAATTCGYTSADARSRLASEYTSWKSGYYRDCGDGSACVVDFSSNRCVSEGIGYGMLIAVNLNHQAEFNALWNFYKARRNANGLMNWSYGYQGACSMNVWGNNAATDGDLDAAMALVQANARWGGYATDATTLITAIHNHETETCSGRIILRPGDAWGGCSDNGQINPSYFAPGYFRAFAHAVPAEAADWNAMVDDAYELYAIWQGRMGGLVPDWSRYDGADWYGAGYSYDACRTPWRVATDYAWSCDSRAQTFLQTISSYVDSHGGISGVSFDKNSAFLGSFALSGQAISQAKFDGYESAWFTSATQDNAYFQSTLRVVYLLVAAGQFPSTL
jgi:endoglucanase